MSNVDIHSFFPKPTYNPFQKDTIDQIYQSFLNGAEYVIVEAPPGSGKTVIAMTFANLFEKSYYLTASRGLQKQILSQFPVKKVDGRKNHKCLIDPKLTADEAPCSISFKTSTSSSTIDLEEYPILKCEYKPDRKTPILLQEDVSSPCSYWDQKIQAIKSKISIHNYDYYLLEMRYAKDFFYPRKSPSQQDLQKLSLGIFDEVHKLENKFIESNTLHLSSKIIKHFNLEVPYSSDQEELINWLVKVYYKKVKEVFDSISSELESILSSLEFSPSITESDKEEIRILEKKLSPYANAINNVQTISSLYNKNPKNWIIISKDNNLSIEPLFVSDFTQDSLFEFFDRKLLLSSTIFDPKKLVSNLGLTGKKVNYISVPSSFPISNHPIYPMNCGILNYSDLKLNMSTVISTIETLLSLFPNKKGLIHSNAFHINDLIYSNLSKPNRYRVITHTKLSGRSYNDALSEHISSFTPTVLMSPSVIEGIDLSGTLSEFQIIVRLFYENENEDLRLKARNAIDPSNRELQSCISMVQAAGRSIRSSTDVAPTFILDSRFGYFCKKNSKILPSHFLNSIVKTPHKYSYITNPKT